MKKQMMKMGMVAALVLAGMSSAYAAGVGKPEVVTFEGNVVDVTCVLTADSTNVNLGDATPASFVNTVPNLTTLWAVASSKESVTLTASGCTGTADAAKDTDVGVSVTGSVLTASDSIFSQDPAATAGVALLNNNAIIKSGDRVSLGPVAQGTTGTIMDGKTAKFDAYLAAPTVTAPTVGSITAPVSFVIDNK